MTKEELLKLGVSEEQANKIAESIIKDAEHIKTLEETNKALVETNKNLTASIEGEKARFSELEKQYKEVLEKPQGEPTKTTDIFEAIVNAK